MDLGRKALVILALLVSVAAPLAAQPHYLVADVNQVEIDGGSEPHDFVTVGDVVYFSAYDDLHGEELWQTDGTAEGTRRVRDVCPGRCSSRPTAMTGVDDLVFFFAYSGGAGRTRSPELWKSDGTAAGTELVRTVCSSGCGWGVQMVAFEGEVYFVGNDGQHGDELWRSDGTAEGTGMVFDIRPGAGSSVPRDLEVFDDRLFFRASEEGSGSELWSSDGTPEGTQLFADLCPGTCSSAPKNLHASLLPGALLFSALDEVAGREMWISDGTAAGTEMLADLRPGADGLEPDSFVSFGGLVYFLDLDFGENPGVWKTDGTPAGTVPAPELLPLGPEAWTYQLQAAGDLLFFALLIDDGRQLWATDGSAGGTRRLADFSGPSLLGLALEDRLTIAVADTLGDAQESLWISDGTTEGTIRLRDVELDRNSFYEQRIAVHQGRLLFAGDDGLAGEELWRSDGTGPGTGMVTQIQPPLSPSYPAQMAALGDRVFFTAYGGAHGRRLWRSDGTGRGTELLEPGMWLTEPPVALGDRLFFAAYDLAFDPNRPFLWVTGGRPGGAVPLAEEQSARQLTVHDDVLFYSLFVPGQQLWRSDGTAAGTFRLKDVYPAWSNGCHYPCIGPPINPPDHLFSSGSYVYFLAFEDVDVPQLWRSDGTASGTVALSDFDDFPGQLTDLDGMLIFVGFTGDSGWEPWRSDGTPEGTTLLADLAPAAASSNPRLLTRAGKRVFFLLADVDGHDELWSTDGTASGTLPVDDLRLDGAGGRARFLTAAGKRLFFTVEHEATGEELWISDGTAAGTGLVADLLPGRGSSRPSALTAVGNVLLFAAEDGAFGKEVWLSDGTAGGTRRLADVMPGSGASDPSEFTIVGERVFFAAGDAELGRELWAVDASALCVGELCAASGPVVGGVAGDLNETGLIRVVQGLQQ